MKMILMFSCVLGIGCESPKETMITVPGMGCYEVIGGGIGVTRPGICHHPQTVNRYPNVITPLAPKP